MEKEYDAIVIGSGIGGLTFASIMAQMKDWRVLVLERHWVLGGFTHTFSRPGGYEWDVGLHYVGGMAKAERARQIFDFISAKKVLWQKMPEDFDKFVYPDFEFDVPSNKQEYINRLIVMFPTEEKAIKQYFKDISKSMAWFVKHIAAKATPAAISKMINLFGANASKMALETTASYLDRNFKDEKLKALLTSQWSDYGLPPSKSSFAVHAIVVSSYFNGAYFPTGGSSTIAKAIVPIIKEKGGDCLVNSEVSEVILEHNQAVGVKLNKKGKTTEYRAKVIVSNTGALSSFNKLIPQSYNLDFREDLNKFAQVGYTNVTLYVGLKQDPSKLGFKGENHWIYSSYNHDECVENKDELLNGKIGGVFLSFPSLKDDKAKGHTAEIITSVSYEAFAAWHGTKWKKRDKDYEELKEKISQYLLDYVEARYPGFKEMVDYLELSTPLTNESFTGHSKGYIYSLPATPERFKKDYLEVATPIKGFYLTGTDVAVLGIVGAMMGGVVTASKFLGAAGFLKILWKVRQYSKST